jgi:hypothetical protein
MDLFKYDLARFIYILRSRNLLNVMKPISNKVEEILEDLREEMHRAEYIIDDHHLLRQFGANDFKTVNEDSFNIDWYGGQNVFLSVTWTGHSVTIKNYDDHLVQSQAHLLLYCTPSG